MRPALTLALAAPPLFAIALYAWVQARPGRADPSGSPAPAAQATAVPLTRTQVVALQATPQAQDWQRRQAFEARMRRFLGEAPHMGAVERSEQARALAASIDGYEGSGGLSAGEAVLLRSGLIKAEDRPDEAERLAELMMRYRDQADRRMQAYARQHATDPRFQAYKAREGAIVAEVGRLAVIPGGLSRDQYLRQRLQEARVAAYR